MRLFSLLACSAMTLLGGCILLYNPDSYQFTNKGGSGGGGSSSVSAGGGTTTSSSSTGGHGGQGVCAEGGAPSPEVCRNEVDEDCDGNTCKTAATWSFRYQDPMSPTAQRSITGVALSDTGQVAIAGWYDGKLVLNAAHSADDTTPNGHNAFSARFGDMGLPDWLDFNNDATGREATAVAISADGNTVAYTGTAQTTSAHAWVAHGHPLDWEVSVTAPADARGTAIALDSSGAVFVALRVVGSTGTLTCSQTGPLDYTTSKAGVIIAKLAASNGGCVWGQFYQADEVTVFGLAVDTLGRPVVALNYVGALSGNVAVNPAPPNGRAGVVFSLTGGQGALRWYKEVAAQNVTLDGVAIGASDRVYVTGSFQGTLNTTPPLSAASRDLLVMAVNGGDSGTPGTILWAERFGGAGVGDTVVRRPQGIAVVSSSDTDAVYVAGLANSSLSLRPNADDDTLCKGGGIFLLKLHGATGNTAWGSCFAEGDLDLATSVRLAANATGLVLAGSRTDPIDFGNGKLEGTAQDAFIAHFPLE